jgi:hypothetical protein
MIGFVLDKFIDDTAAVIAAEQRGTIRSLSKAAFQIFKDAQASIEPSPEASPPGSPPHTRRGQLKRAIRYDVDKSAGIAVIGPRESMVGTSAEAAEFGGEYKGQQYPKRPFMGPALDKDLNLLPAFWSSEIHN